MYTRPVTCGHTQIMKAFDRFPKINPSFGKKVPPVPMETQITFIVCVLALTAVLLIIHSIWDRYHPKKK
ncbi:MAG: hypothetical protein JSR58_07720 [Verrucomicrobia bacterium]|nr:hypothetical protein [Verrucomicrobiota bacterium]